ncbi:hypothetical protein LIS04_201 [Listeria phage LIS04]|nr:hypothetical protein LIS04_201 [Listeria phage LIS04]
MTKFELGKTYYSYYGKYCSKARLNGLVPMSYREFGDAVEQTAHEDQTSTERMASLLNSTKLTEENQGRHFKPQDVSDTSTLNIKKGSLVLVNFIGKSIVGTVVEVGGPSLIVEFLPTQAKVTMSPSNVVRVILDKFKSLSPAKGIPGSLVVLIKDSPTTMGDLFTIEHKIDDMFVAARSHTSNDSFALSFHEYYVVELESEDEDKYSIGNNPTLSGFIEASKWKSSRNSKYLIIKTRDKNDASELRIIQNTNFESAIKHYSEFYDEDFKDTKSGDTRVLKFVFTNSLDDLSLISNLDEY